MQTPGTEIATELLGPLFTLPVQRHPLSLQRTGTGMSGSNGVDLGQVLTLLGDVLVGQREMRDEIRLLDLRMDRLEHRMDELAGQVATYHGSVVGHCVLISEMDTRLRTGHWSSSR